MALGQVLAGNFINAADVRSELDELASYAQEIVTTKASPTSRNSTITCTADPDLAIVLPANRSYWVRLDVLLSSAANAAGDFRLRWAWTNTATVTWRLAGLSDTLASGSAADLLAIAGQADTTSPTADTQFGASTTITNSTMFGEVVTGGTAVTLTLEWAQLASNASNTTVNALSRFSARRFA